MSTKYCRPFRRGESWRSQNFRDNPNNGTNGPGGHTGNDEAAPIGTPVHAAGDGVIEYAGTFDSTYADNFLWLLDFGGNILVLNCGDDEPTFIYAHLSRFRVSAGDRVGKGQIIGLSGNTGTRTTGAHLHMESIPPGYSLNSPTLGRADPDTYLTEWPEDVATVTVQSTTAPTQRTTTTEDEDMALVLVKGADEAIWIGDFVTRRRVPDLETLADIQWRHETGEIRIINDGKVIEGNVEMAGQAF